jgi:hypothetical protein
MPKVKSFNIAKQVWFMKTPVGKNILRQLSKKLTNDIPTLKVKRITNKTKWGIAISKMVDALVPIEYGMKISNHCNAKSYAK